MASIAAGVMAWRKASATACSITIPPTLRQYTPRPLTDPCRRSDNPEPSSGHDSVRADDGRSVRN